MPGAGTVTLMFTDLVGSTELLVALGEDRFDSVRDEHDALVGGRIAAHHGKVVKHTGDGYMAAFPGAAAAIATAAEIQRLISERNEASDVVLGVRIGISTGDVAERAGDYHGVPAVEAARLCAVATSGQILASETVRALAGSWGGHDFVALGELDLKGLPPVSAVAVRWCDDAPVSAPSAIVHERLVASHRFLAAERTHTLITRVELVDPKLVGRAEELRTVRDLLDAVATGMSSVLVVQGEAGHGKTVLLEGAEAAAQARGFVVLRGMGIEFERDLAFSGLTAVLRPVLHLADELPVLQARSLRGALGLEESEGRPLSVYSATLSLLSSAAESGPVVVCVDDAQWLDRSSLEAVVFAAHRCEADRVGFMFTQRTGVPCLLDVTGFRRIELAGLAPDAAIELLEREGLARDVAARFSALTDGNPLALIEGARALSAAQRAGDAPLPSVLPIGPRLMDSFRRRLGELPDATQQALGVAAVESDGGAAIVAAALARLGGSLRDLLPAEEIGVVTVGDGRVSWRHPLVRAAIYHRLGGHRRRELHATLAEAVASAGDDDRAAWHLAESAIGPDEVVAERLAEVGRVGVRRGALNAAAQAFDAAARLSISAAERDRNILAAAEARWVGAQPERVVADLGAVIGHVEDTLTRARMAVVLGQAETWLLGSGAATTRFEAHASAVHDTAPDLAAILLVHATTTRLLELDPSGALATADRAVAAAAATDDMAALFAASATRTIVGLFAGEGHTAAVGLESIGQMALAALDTGAAGVDAIVQMCAFGHAVCENWPTAIDLLRRVIQQSDDSGMVGRSMFARIMLADVLYRAGRWAESLADMSQVLSMQEATGFRQLVPVLGGAVLARIEAGLGLADPCRAHAAQADEAAASLGIALVRAWSLSAVGLLELGAAHHTAAADAFDQVAALAGHAPEPGWLWWQADAVEALAATGRTRDANEALDRLEAQATATDRCWALAATERAGGLLRRGPAPEDRFTAALEGFHSAAVPFEEARTLLVRGEHRLREGRERDGARDVATARTIFDRLGARPWSERASRLRGEASGSDRSLASRLTGAELRVAMAVGQGASNRDAADQLFISTKTVDYHLQNIYRKLGLRSRTQLARIVLTAAGASS